MMEKPAATPTAFSMARFPITRQQSKRMTKRVNEGDRGLVKLDFSHLPLYGRFQEKLSLLNSLNRVGIAGTPGEVLMLFGKSGTGKTALVRESLQDFKETHFLGRGKFEASKLSHCPFAAIVEAFAEIVAGIIDQMGKDGEDYASAVSDALGDEAYRITTLIPELVDLIGERPPNDDQQYAACDYTTFRRFLNLMRCLLRAICSFQILVVLWFDDLHLADPDSLALIKYLSNDPGAMNVLIIGSFEDYDHCAISEVSDLLGEMDQVKTTLMRLGNLTLASVTSMIVDVMATDEELTTPLARAVFKRTKGNAFFVIQFLELIQELGLLQYDVKAKLWVWDLTIMKQATSVLKEVEKSSGKAQYAVLARLSHLPKSSKTVLSTAASLGSCTFGIKLLATLLNDKGLTGDDVQDTLSSSSLKVEYFMSAMVSSFRGLDQVGNPENEVVATMVALEKIGMVERFDSNLYRFAHDVIQEGAYHLLPDQERHWKTGQCLKRLLDKRVLEDDRLFFTMIDQLNRGSFSISDDEERLELSSLNLRAAYKARERSAFACAAHYARCGIAYLGETKWETNQALAMKLEILAAEAAFSSGDMEACLAAAEQAIENGVDVLQKIPAYILRVKVLTRLRQSEVAVKCALEVFEQLGEKFACKPSRGHVAISLMHSKRLLNDRPDELLLDAPINTNVVTSMTMQLLALSIRCLSDPAFMDFVTMLKCRMLQIAIKHGLCDESAVAFTGFGRLLATAAKESGDAYRAGSLGLQLQQLVDSPRYDARVSFEFFAFTHHLKQPIRHSLGPLYQSYLKGLRYGVIEDSLRAASVYCQHYFCSGRPLVAITGVIDECTNLAKEYMPCLHLSMIAYAQLAQNLMGKAPNKFTLNGRAMDLEETIVKIKSDDNDAARRMLLCAQAEHACWFQLYQVADKILREIDKLPQDDDFNASFTARRLVFINGLVSMGLVKSLGKSGPHLRHARECARILLKYSQQGAVDCVELHEILEAELRSIDVKRDEVDVTRAYQKAIASAASSCAHHNVALANELAGRHQLSLNEQATAMLFFRQAYLAYTEWNAFEKANELMDLFPELGDQIDCTFAPTRSFSTMYNGADKVVAERRNANSSMKDRVFDNSTATSDTTLDASSKDGEH